nr:DUF3578 domain-containing protein [Bacillus sp. ISL-39]
MENIIIELIKKLDHIKKLNFWKENKIVNVGKTGIYIMTKDSLGNQQMEEKNKPQEFISNDFILNGWLKFISIRKTDSNDLKKHLGKGNTSFLINLFSLLPFVEISRNDIKLEIRLLEFQTDDLPNVPFKDVKSFLEEVSEKNLEPKNFNEYFDDNMYRVKSRSRQDVRLLGLINEYNEINKPLFNKYKNIENKDLFLSNLLKNQGYFRVALICLDLMRNMAKSDKKIALLELGMLIVRNSKGENLMVKSVAKERTNYLLMWLEQTSLIDRDWSPKQNFFIDTFNLAEDCMISNLRGSLQRLMSEYLSIKAESIGVSPNIGSFVRNEIPEIINNLHFIDRNQYIITGSVGVGRWALVPWVAIMNREVTTSTKKGYYIVYLFSEDMKSVYLTIGLGVEKTPKEDIKRIKEDIRKNIPRWSKVNKDDYINLGSSSKAKDYAYSTAVYIKYEYENMPGENALVHDLEEMINIYENFISIKNGSVPSRYEGDIMSENPHDVTREKFEYLSYNDLVSHIYSFIKGKGFYYEKDEIINLFLSLKTKPFVIISGISGTGKTKIVQWFAESVGATEKNGQFSLIPIRPDWNDGSDLLGYVDIKGEFKEGPLTKVIKNAHQNPELPYFVLLDEMNLARVEYYFSDILSVMESRKWENDEVVSSTLLSSDVYGEDVTLPTNLYIIGTVNMDETTHPFSKKVLDRANTIEFNRVNLGNLAFLTELKEVEPKVIGQDRFASKYLHLKDVYKENKEIVARATEELVRINESLQLINAHVGYRVRDEICFYLAYNEESSLMEFENAFDHCILQKILPRIAGSDTRVEQLLRGLYSLFTNQDYEEDGQNDIHNGKYPRSAAKVAEMLGRLRNHGFTSFWIS